MLELLVCAFYLLPNFLLDEVFFFLKGIFPDRPKPWCYLKIFNKTNTEKK